MAVLEVSAGQLRGKQKNFFEIADAGRQMATRRCKRKSYPVTGADQDDFIVTPELLAKIERAEQQMRDGKYTECKTIEELNKFLDSL